MPFYEYECSDCRYYAEVMQKITDKPLKKCPSCGKATFKKLISAPVFRLKGSGWYETDFKSDQDSKRNLAASDKEDAAVKGESKTETKTEPAAAGEGKSDSKVDTKAEAKTEAKGAGKTEAAASGHARKPPAVTTRNIRARAAAGKGAATKRARPAKHKASKRRGGR